MPIIAVLEDKVDTVRIHQWITTRWQWSVYFSVAYLILIFGTKYLMRSRKPFNLRRPLVVWNITLAGFSVFECIIMLPALWDLVSVHGLTGSVCIPVAWHTKDLTLWGFLFSLSKVLELFDTAFIVLRKTPLIFLHWYHHITVLIFTWYIHFTWMALGQWFTPVNALVHMLMYSYYALRAAGFKLPSNLMQVITVLQITQMFVGLFANLVAVRELYHERPCYLTWQGFAFSMFIYSTYALLFLHFFYQRYMKGQSAKKAQ